MKLELHFYANYSCFINTHETNNWFQTKMCLFWVTVCKLQLLLLSYSLIPLKRISITYRTKNTVHRSYITILGTAVTGCMHIHSSKEVARTRDICQVQNIRFLTMHSFKRAGHLKLYRVYAGLSLLLLTGIQKKAIPMNMILKQRPTLPRSSTRCKMYRDDASILFTNLQHTQPAGSTSFQMSS
jgi:hypothetical protein